jgi:hypothetical protein
MLVQIPETTAMTGRIPFDFALGPILFVALLVVLAIGVLNETQALPALRARLRGEPRPTRRLVSVTPRA